MFSKIKAAIIGLNALVIHCICSYGPNYRGFLSDLFLGRV
jgi:hypothetical protein